MEELEFPTTAGLLAQSFGAQVLGNSEAEIHGLTSLALAKTGSLAFFSDRKYAAHLGQLEGAVLLTSPELARPELPLTFILVSEPQRVFAEIAKRFRPRPAWTGISPQASIHSSAVLEAGVTVGPFAFIGEGARIGRGTIIYPYGYVGAQVTVGESCEVHPNAVLLDRITLGNRVKVFSGAVLGSDGFGFMPGTEGYSEMPQIGTVVIEDDVRIGAQSTIDRATLGETRISRGSKLDDHVHVGHNCNVGKNVILCAQVGLGGSAIIEDDAILGGQVGIGHGVKIGKAARMGGQSGTSTNLKGGETYFLTPALRMVDTVKVVRYLRKLPVIWERLSRVEKQLASLAGLTKEGSKPL